MAQKNFRLPSGYGSIYKLSGNRRRPYRVRITTDWEIDMDTMKCNQVRKTIGYAKTRQEAIQMLAEYHHHPLDLNETRTTFYEVYERYYKEYLEPYEYEKKKKNNINRFKGNVKVFESIYNVPFNELKLNDFQKIIDKCGKNYPTLKSIKTTLRQLCEYAMKYDIITKDYSQFVDILKYKDRNPNALNRTVFSDTQIKKLWKDSGDIYVQVILMLIYCGVRVSELLNLKKEDVDLEHHVFNIVDAKTAAGIRVVPIADKVFPFYQQWMKHDCEYLICNKDDLHCSYENYRDTYWDPIMERLNMKHTPHDTRHTCISLLTKADVNPTTIKKIVGHKGAMSLTEKVYTHMDYQMLLDAINKI